MVLHAGTLTGALQSILAKQDLAHRLRRDIERYENAVADREEAPHHVLQESDSENDARGLFAGALLSYFHSLTVAMEASGLPGEAESLRSAWKAFSPETLGATKWDGEHEYSASEPLRLLDDTFEALSGLVGNPVEERELAKLEQLLAATANIVHREGVTPTRELDVQAVMHKYLEVFYDGQFQKNPSIRGSLQDFEADSGIAHLKAAIEFKFVDNEGEAKTAIRGILEDTAGYKGSSDWTRFYAVIYQTGPWVSEHRYREEVRRVGADTWKVVVVVGGGARKKKKKAAGNAVAGVKPAVAGSDNKLPSNPPAGT